jgi:hypothetical protein
MYRTIAIALMMLTCAILYATEATAASTADDRRKTIDALIQQIPVQLDVMFYQKGFKDGNGTLIYHVPAFSALRRFCTAQEWEEVKLRIHIPPDPFAPWPRSNSTSASTDSTSPRMTLP